MDLRGLTGEGLRKLAPFFHLRFELESRMFLGLSYPDVNRHPIPCYSLSSKQC